MINVYCEVGRGGRHGFSWRIIAECGELGKFVGEWITLWEGFAQLSAPSGTGGQVQHWLAGSGYWSDEKQKLFGVVQEFVPFTIGETLGSEPVNIPEE